jgi:hypothetical protein
MRDLDKHREDVTRDKLRWDGVACLRWVVPPRGGGI